ncbi:MAG TPA: GAF domain-containing protein [Rhodanobacteraceae bacterium]|nr:GAF domain-containing protein [Rhodanobacteraceae bacterium]
MAVTAAKPPRRDEAGLLRAQARVLEMIAIGAPLAETLVELIGFMESREPGLRCNVLPVSGDGGSFGRGTGPSLPDGYQAVLDGSPVQAPYFSPCSEAVDRSEAVEVSDVAAATRWSEAWRQAALQAGLRACRSTPVRSGNGRPLASLAMYYDRPRDPQPATPDLIGIATHLICIAMERDEQRAEAARREGERQSREMLDALPVAVYKTDADGKITYYNPAAAELAGREPTIGGDEWCVSWRLHTADGSPMRHDECPMALALKENRRILGAEAMAERPDHTLVPFLAYPVPLRDPAGRPVGALNTLVDITRRKRSEQSLRRLTHRLQLINRIAKSVASDLDLERIVQDVTDSATEVIGARFGAFFYNVTDDQGERYRLFALSGAPREAFEKFGTPRNSSLFGRTFRGEGIVRCDNVHADPRYGKNPPYHGMPKGHLPVVSYLAVPVVSRSGEVLGGLFFGHDRAGMFTEESEELVSGIAGHAALAIDNARLLQAAQTEVAERRAAEAHRELLLREVNHRAKNLLHTVQSVAVHTRHNAESLDAFESVFMARLGALSHTHDLLSRSNWRGARLRDLARQELEPYRGSSEPHWVLRGELIELDARTALSLGMVLHELATNAGKYGALSTTRGQVSLSWRIVHPASSSPQRVLHISWVESGGPTVRAPERRGFGSRLIEEGLAYELDAQVRLDYRREGLCCTMDVPLGEPVPDAGAGATAA